MAASSGNARGLSSWRGQEHPEGKGARDAGAVRQRLEFGHFEAADIAIRSLIPIHFVAHFVLHFVVRRLESRHHRADPA